MAVTIRQIIENKSVETLMQLVISPNRDFTAGVEALARGVDFSDGSMILPFDLFRMAEEDGLSDELEELLIKKAVKTFKPIQEVKKDLLLFINISDGFLERSIESTYLEDVAQEFGVSFQNIVFDINPLTENAMEWALRFVEKYRPLGFYICIDDIGVGYNNIDKVLYLSPDMIKINVAAARKLTNKTYHDGMTKFLKHVADQHGILLVSKGIEDDADVQMSLDNGVQFMQGYFISKPVNLEKVSLVEIIDRYREVMKPIYKENDEDLETNRGITARIINISKEVRDKISARSLEETQQDSEVFFENYPFIENIWFLDKNGKQLGSTLINTSHYPVKNSPMFQIYNEGSDFSSKDIYQQLTGTILDIWVTKPYRSILTNNPVIGCSIYEKEGSEDTILCFNFNYGGILEHIGTR